MVISAQLAVILALSWEIGPMVFQAPSMVWTPFQPAPRARPSPPETTAATRADPWIEYAQAPKELREKHMALVQVLLDARLQITDKVGELPPSYTAALEAGIGGSAIANGDEKMNFGCVGEPGVPSWRLVLCAFDSQNGLLLVQYGGLKPGAWLKLYSVAGVALRERAVYAFTRAFTGGTVSSDLLDELNAVVGRRDEIYSVLRRYLYRHPESSYLNKEQ